MIVGDGEGIDRFAILCAFRSVLTEFVCSTRYFLDFRIGFSINSLREWQVYFSMDFLDENRTDEKKKIPSSARALRAQQHSCQICIYLQPVAKPPIRWMLLLWYNWTSSSSYCCTTNARSFGVVVDHPSSSDHHNGRASLCSSRPINRQRALSCRPLVCLCSARGAMQVKLGALESGHQISPPCLWPE